MARRWNNEEVNAPVEKVGENYHFLTSALSSMKTKTMVEDKWKKIAADINAMDVNSPPYPVDKVKRKWFDLKSISKKAVAFYKKELLNTSGGVSKADVPTDLQFKISEIIGDVCTEGVSGTLLCDTSGNTNVSFEESLRADTDNNPDSITPPTKRRKKNPTSREIISREILDGQQAVVTAVGEVRDQLKNLNATLQRLTAVMTMKFQHNKDENLSAFSQFPEDYFTDLLNTPFNNK